jgi:hypothetical protein
LVVKVEGREALPVRAIPYVTGWTISPDVVAESFAKAAVPGFEKLRNTGTYHTRDGQVVKLLPKEWDACVAALSGLQAALKERFDNDDIGYAAWLARSVSKLPAGVFVWFDDFVQDFEHDYSPERRAIIDERPGDRELNLSPHLDNETLNTVIEGFDSRKPLLSHAGVGHVAGVAERVLNGRFIDWDYWVEKMPTLSAAEASRLMTGLDPELYADLTAKPMPQNDTSRACAAARRIERLAEAEGAERRSPAEWYRWALERDFSVHHGFFRAVRGRYLEENEADVLAAMPRSEARRWEEAQPHGVRHRQVSETYAGHVSTAPLTFLDFCAGVEERLARWRRGRYMLIEAAQVIADHGNGVDADSLANQMDQAIHAGKLTYRINNIRAEPRFIPQQHLWHRDVFQEDVNAWLAAEGRNVRLEYPYPDARPKVRQGAAPAPDYRVLASREQLIAAFGAFTGMDMSWFDSLKDTPALKAARRVVGSGRRGSTVQPMFCPFATMLWLVNPKRKKGRALAEDTGWRLLAQYFPRVYASKSAADPREERGAG